MNNNSNFIKEIQNDKIKKLLTKEGFEELKNNKWKSLFILPYAIISPIIYTSMFKPFNFKGANTLTNKVTELTKLGYDVLFIPAVITGGFLLIISGIGIFRKRPKEKVNEFLKTPLLNKQGEPPMFLYMKKDKNKKHGQILAYSSEGIKLEEFLKEIESIEYVYKKYKVYNITNDFIDRTKIYIHRIPSKYAKPRVISADDDFLSDLINMLIVGATGTGKSYTILSILCKLALYINGVSISICDYKNSSIFAPFRNSTNYYGGEDVVNGIIEFYNELKHRIELGTDECKEQVRVLMVDEYSSVIDEFDKEYDLKKKIAYILNMGREYNMRIIVRYSKGW